jgi:transposase InsO family protein
MLTLVDEYTRECLAIDVGRRLNSTEAKVLIERWRRESDTLQPHSALGYRPPALWGLRAYRFHGSKP